jgi:vancomycin aglycone glucosyltransferase
MRILISAEGSRGDLVPMIELAAHLGHAGHDVRLCGPPDFAATAAERGVAYVSLGLSFQVFLTEHAHLMRTNPVTTMAEAMRYLRDQIEARCDALVEHAAGADLLVAGGAEAAAASVAERHGIAYRYVAYCPAFFPSREHGPIFVPWQPASPLLNRLLWPLVMAPLRPLVRRILDAPRRRLGLGSCGDWFAHLLGTRPVLAADRRLAAAPADARVAITQVPALHALAGDPLPEKLDRFLGAGSPAVYVGFGSMPDADPGATTQMVVEASERAGCRVVIGAGWAALGEGPLPSHVTVAGTVSHASLFPRCAAIVHHGGAGTTTTAARAGVPQVVVPHVVDQYYWGRRIRLLGLGPPPIPRRRLDAIQLAETLEAVVGNELLAERAADFGAGLRSDLARSSTAAEVLAGELD